MSAGNEQGLFNAVQVDKPPKETGQKEGKGKGTSGKNGQTGKSHGNKGNKEAAGDRKQEEFPDMPQAQYDHCVKHHLCLCFQTGACPWGNKCQYKHEIPVLDLPDEKKVIDAG